MPASRKLGRIEALAMAREAHRLVAAKGKKVTTIDLRTAPPADDVLAGLMLGPTGNLRAPTMRVGQTILVGYNDQAFTDMFVQRAAKAVGGSGDENRLLAQWTHELPRRLYTGRSRPTARLQRREQLFRGGWIVRRMRRPAPVPEFVRGSFRAVRPRPDQRQHRDLRRRRQQRHFAQGAPQNDDVTALVVRFAAAGKS